MAKKTQSNLFIGSLICSFLSAILVLAEDFAGWYNYSSYGQVWGWVGFSFTKPISFLIFGAAAAILFFSSYISYQKLSNKKVKKELIEKAFYGSLGITALSLIGGLYFIVDMIVDEPTNWWLGPGFYAGTIGAGLNTLFLKLALKK